MYKDLMRVISKVGSRQMLVALLLVTVPAVTAPAQAQPSREQRLQMYQDAMRKIEEQNRARREERQRQYESDEDDDDSDYEPPRTRQKTTAEIYRESLENAQRLKRAQDQARAEDQREAQRRQALTGSQVNGGRNDLPYQCSRQGGHLDPACKAYFPDRSQSAATPRRDPRCGNSTDVRLRDGTIC